MRQRVLDGDFYDLLEVAAKMADSLEVEYPGRVVFEGTQRDVEAFKAIVERLWQEYKRP